VDLAAARAAYDAKAWQRAFDAYAAAPRLGADDLDRYAVSAMLLGRLDDYFAIRERAYRQLLSEGDVLGAAMAAGWIGAQHMAQGEIGPGTGWLARAGRLAEQLEGESVPHGYLALSQVLEATASGDLDRAVAQAAEAAAIGRRTGDHDLAALATHQEGVTLLRVGRVQEGLSRLDEAMVALTAGELSPMVTGIIYCGVVAGCWTVYELRRAQQWTVAMSRWCDSQPDLVSFTGECKVRRAELKQLNGEWSQALDELDGVSPADMDRWAAGAAAYVRGNLDRLQGRFNSAEEHFALAAKLGVDPQPGLAQLRLAHGSVQAAAAMVRRSLAEVRDPGRRIELLFAATEILLAVGEPDEAAAATIELRGMAERQSSPVVTALAAQAGAELDLAKGSPESALAALRSALRTWLDERAPYLEARARVLVANACRALGDVESSGRELETARAIFDQLGAGPDLAKITGGDGVLTSRELEVLRLLATGATNKAIAAKLVLSERTVDRHVSNIFSKLGLSTRAAATAYAFSRQLV
jgi:DNA-binding NarL/FixJ family response regulator